jgi:hypothetical protein
VTFVEDTVARLVALYRRSLASADLEVSRACPIHRIGPASSLDSRFILPALHAHAFHPVLLSAGRLRTHPKHPGMAPLPSLAGTGGASIILRNPPLLCKASRAACFAQRGLTAATKGEPRLLEKIYATCGEVGEGDSNRVTAGGWRRRRARRGVRDATQGYSMVVSFRFAVTRRRLQGDWEVLFFIALTLFD